MKKSRLLGAVCFGAYLLIAGNAQAVPTTINAADYNVGDVIYDVPGAKVGYYTIPSGEEIRYYNGVEVSSVPCANEPVPPGDNCTINVLDSTSSNDDFVWYMEYGDEINRSPNGIFVSAENGPLLNIGFTGIGIVPDDYLMFFYGNNNNILGYEYIDSSPLDEDCNASYPNGSKCYSFSYSADLTDQGVYQVMFGGSDSEVYTTSLTYSTVPAPPILYLLAPGLLGLVGKAR